MDYGNQDDRKSRNEETNSDASAQFQERYDGAGQPGGGSRDAEMFSHWSVLLGLPAEFPDGLHMWEREHIRLIGLLSQATGRRVTIHQKLL